MENTAALSEALGLILEDRRRWIAQCEAQRTELDSLRKHHGAILAQLTTEEGLREEAEADRAALERERVELLKALGVAGENPTA